MPVELEPVSGERYPRLHLLFVPPSENLRPGPNPRPGSDRVGSVFGPFFCDRDAPYLHTFRALNAKPREPLRPSCVRSCTDPKIVRFLDCRHIREYGPGRG